MEQQTMTIRFNFLLLTTLLTAILIGCGGGETTTESGKLNVVATSGHLHDAVVNIAGDAVTDKGLLGPGVDPHAYEPPPSAISQLNNADVIFYNGLNLEAGMGEILDQLAKSDEKVVVAVADRFPEDRLLGWETYAHDPHVWNDPTLWREAAVIVRDTLVEADPDNAETYTQNTEAYIADIDATHEELTALFATIPEGKRTLITAHDAFSYLARTYDLEVMGLQGISTQDEPSIADVTNLANFIVENEIPAIFVESSVSKAAVEAVQAAVADQGFTVEIGGELLSDALGEPGTEGESYTGMLRQNGNSIVNGLTR